MLRARVPHILVAFATRLGLKHPDTRAFVELLGPCSKTGRTKPPYTDILTTQEPVGPPRRVILKPQSRRLWEDARSSRPSLSLTPVTVHPLPVTQTDVGPSNALIHNPNPPLAAPWLLAHETT